MFKYNGRISIQAEYEILCKEPFEAECTDGFLNYHLGNKNTCFN